MVALKRPASRWPLVVAAAGAWLLSAAQSLAFQGQAPLTVVDQQGHAELFHHSPRRVVSLLPSLTETVCALQACDRLVGVDQSSNEPASVRRLPKVGGLHDTQFEAIARLKPDLVLAATSTRGLTRLRQLGLPVLVFEPQNQQDARRAFEALGPLWGVNDAATRWSGLMQAIAAAAQQLPIQAQGWRVYIEVAQGPYAASAGSFMGELASELGFAPIVPASLGPFPKLSPEFVVQQDPELIIATATSVEALRRRPGWQQVSAVRHGQICALTPAEADTFSRPGPRLPLAAQAIVDCVRRITAQRR